MSDDIIMTALLIAWAIWSYKLLDSSCFCLELELKKSANRDLLGIILELASAMRQDLFRLAQAGQDVPPSAQTRLLSIVNLARNMEARNEALYRVQDARALEEEIDVLYQETLIMYTALKDGS